MKFTNFVQRYLISCLVQLLRITFHKMFYFTLKFLIFLSLVFQFISVYPQTLPPPPRLPLSLVEHGGGGGVMSW